ncbi:hypothetical protein K438DRAFT_411998 [Mycena galopus ATCC 62051]|nr:hypothetical protein K438DRAFT_411998 [Mycena galopus ATCC 62051]
MKVENLRLRLRLCDIESELGQMESHCDSRDPESSPTPSQRPTPQGTRPEERKTELMMEKTSIQNSLGLIIYPILTIPVEIISEIFLHCLPALPAAYAAAHLSTTSAPLLLGRICRMWREIAYTNPRLWTALKVSSWRGNGFQCMVQEWLRRAGSMPLSLDLAIPSPTIRCPFTPSAFCNCPFFSHFEKRLTYSCPSPSLFTDHWRHLTSFAGHNFTVDECISILQVTPRLVRCELASITGPLPTPTARVLLVNIEELTAVGESKSLLLLLDSLALPGLRSLSLGLVFPRFSEHRLLSFLQRAPSVHTFGLRLYGSPTEGEDRAMITILNAMPALSSFTLRQCSLSAALAIIDSLESTAFIPRLQKLFLSTTHPMSPGHLFIPILLKALGSRLEGKSGVAQLVDFQFLFPTHPDVSYAKLSDGILKLRERGMRINVSGT